MTMRLPLLPPGLVLGVLLAPLAPRLVVAADEAAGGTRVTEAIDGVTYSFDRADESVVRALAPLVAQLKREAASPAAPAGAATPGEPFGVSDLQTHRDDYLRQSAAFIGLDQPTALQRECYDGYLDNFARMDRAFALLLGHMRTLFDVRAITLYRKADLIRRLKAGEKIPGATLNADGTGGSFNFNPELHGRDDELKELFAARQQRRLDFGYNYQTKDGVVDLSAYTRIGARSKPAPAADTDAKPIDWKAEMLPPLPVVIPPENDSLPPTEIATALVPFVESFVSVPRRLEGKPVQTPAALAYLILHETTEIGIVGHYLGSADRRWLCEGVANLAAWKIASDRAGNAVARWVYDLPGQVEQAAALRDRVDLRRWAAAENQRKEDADTPLTRAHYAFATRAVALMLDRHGDDFLRRLFREIGRTPRAKADMRTVGQAYQRLTGEDLAVLLAAAMAPVPVAQTPSPDLSAAPHAADSK